MTERLLTISEVAALFRVDPKTVARWLAGGRLTRVDTPGGKPRVRESECTGLLQPSEIEAPQ
jgi:excisionase family DNA binding protein